MVEAAKKWTMEHLPKERVLVCTCHGTISEADTRALGLEAFAEAAKLGVRCILVDDSEMTPQATTMQIYATARSLPSLGMQPFHRVAVVFPPQREGAADLRFFESACRNAGNSLQLFSDVASAMAWLEEA